MGIGEIALIALVALIIFGPKKLPELGKALGQGIREFKKAGQALTEDVKSVAQDPAPAAKQPEAPAAEGPKA
ncbi:MAG: twin-arginine translocase TatA/TatE family subunit [Mycobacterium leprae]